MVHGIPQATPDQGNVLGQRLFVQHLHNLCQLQPLDADGVGQEAVDHVRIGVRLGILEVWPWRELVGHHLEGVPDCE